MHDFVQLDREQMIDLRDARVDHRLGVARHRHRAFEHLGDELLDQILAALLRCRVASEAAFLRRSGRAGSTSSVVCPAACARSFLRFSHWTLPFVFGLNSPFNLFELVGVAHRVVQQLVQFVVALQAAAQIGQLGAQVEQFLQRLDLLRHLFGLEVVQALEVQVHLELARIGVIAELVFDREGQVRLHALQHAVEVVGIDFDKLPVLQLWAAARRAGP